MLISKSLMTKKAKTKNHWHIYSREYKTIHGFCQGNFAFSPKYLCKWERTQDKQNITPNKDHILNRKLVQGAIFSISSKLFENTLQCQWIAHLFLFI